MAAMTLGRRSLLAVLQRTTARELAARCRVAKQTVSDWVNGHRKPNHSARLALQHLYGISARAWDAPSAAPSGDRR